jgi:hypothetical protein
MGFGPQELFEIQCDLDREMYDSGTIKDEWWDCKGVGPDGEHEFDAGGFELRDGLSGVTTDFNPRGRDAFFVAHFDEEVECAVEGIEKRNRMWCRKS